jgi:RNA polymerase sigma factor (sigma-70 family)
MDELQLADEFNRQRPQLVALAYRILGSLSEAEDPVQEAWLRLRGTDAARIESLERWLTTVLARLCLNMLRSRRTRGEQPLDAWRPEPIIDDPAVGTDPEHEALLADSVGIALQVVLDTLAPAERLAFVLHDMFAVPFDEIAALVDRSPAATRQLASRARRRVQSAAPRPDPDLTRQRVVVDAYFAAAREGDLEALAAVLDPDVVLRAHRRDGDPLTLHGAARVAQGALSARHFAPYVRPALINGAAGVVAFDGDRPFAVLAFTIVGDRALAIDVFNDPELVGRLDIHGITPGATRATRAT